MDDPPKAAAHLKRSMHGVGALMITLSGLSPTIGVFVVGSDVIHQAGSGAVLCFLAAALLGVAMAAVYGELVSAFPETGGEYTIIGRTLGPTLGFSALGLNLANFTIAQALSGLGIVTYLRGVFPNASPAPVAVALIVAVSAIAVLRVRLNALVTGAFLGLEVASLVLLTALGLLHPHRAVLVSVMHPLTLGQGGHLVTASLAIMGTAAAGAIYAFDGFGGVVALGEELHDAPRRVAPVIFWALGLAAMLELAPVLAVILGAPDLKVLIAAEAPLPAFIETVGGPWLGTIMSLAVALAIFNAMIALALMAGRQLFSTGRDQVWPESVNAALTQLHSRFNSPWIATLVMGGVSILWCLAPLSLLVTIIASITIATYAGLCVSVIVGRRTGSTRHTACRMPLFPAAPILALIALAGVAWASFGDAEVGRPGLIITLVIVACSGLGYRFLLAPKGTWAFRGPTEI
jgi:amino acid transporter